VTKIIPCPLCSAAAFQVVARRTRRGTEYQCVRCDACGFHYVNPEPAAPELAAFYDEEYRSRHDDVWHGLEDSANRAVIAMLRARGVRSLTDLGAGQGRFVSMARAAGLEATGVEPIAVSVAEAKRRYGFDLATQSVAAYIASKPRDVECFTMLNVLEHLPDPVGVLRALREALRPGGTVLAIVPNVAFTLTLGRVRRTLRFRDVFMMESPRFSQQGFDPPVHLSSFNAPHLRSAFERAGFRVDAVRQAPVIRAKSTTMNAAKHSVALVGRALELASFGASRWGYSLLAVASRHT
jgi:SAM-dependent methyltransferase